MEAGPNTTTFSDNMPVFPFEECYLNMIDQGAILREAYDHLACQLDNFGSLTQQNGGRVPRTTESNGFTDPADTDNPGAFSVIIQYEGQSMHAASLPASVRIVNHLEKFTCFNNLPPELRAQIWDLALPTEVQVIELYRTKLQIFNYRMPRVVRNGIGGLFLACRESNEVVNMHYSPVSFGISEPRCRILMKPKSDIIYFPSADQILLQMRVTSLHYQSSLFSTLAMPSAVLKFFLMNNAGSKVTNTDEFKRWLPALSGLKTLLLITKETHEQRGRQLDLLPYTGPHCQYMTNLVQAWEDVTQELGLDIQLVWVNPYRDGVLARGVVHAH